MMYQPKILAFAGSLRRHSLNKRIVKVAAAGAEKAGAAVTYLDLNDVPMPVYNADDQIEFGFSEHTLRMQGLLHSHDGLLIATPSYNGSLPAALKNVIDWCSRENEVYRKTDVFPGKVAAIISASPGSLGGVRALGHLRDVLSSVKVQVLPTEIAVPFAAKRFDGNGTEMIDEQMKQSLEQLGVSLVEMLRRMQGWSGAGVDNGRLSPQTQRIRKNG